MNTGVMDGLEELESGIIERNKIQEDLECQVAFLTNIIKLLLKGKYSRAVSKIRCDDELFDNLFGE